MLGRKTKPNTSASRSEIPPWNDRSWRQGAQQIDATKFTHLHICGQTALALSGCDVSKRCS